MDWPNIQFGNEDDDLPATQIVDDRVLKNVVAYVEVRSTNDNRSEAVRRELEQLGATVVKKFTSDVTHVIFKEGSNRTKAKAKKKNIHLVSVLWVDNCKQNEEHVSERMYPAFVPRLKGTPLLMTKLKKAKSMQPRDFEEELASSAERVCRKKKRLEAINRLHSTSTTPSNSPRAPILVQDTQPRSPDDGFVLTPVRLTIPDTPPSMREKMRKLKLLKEGGAGSYVSDVDSDAENQELHHAALQPIQRTLFRSNLLSCDLSSPTQSPNTSSVFVSDAEHTETADETFTDSPNKHSLIEIPNDKHKNTKDKISVAYNTDYPSAVRNNKDIDGLDYTPTTAGPSASDTSLNEDILKLAENINATLNTQAGGFAARCFGVDSDENLLSSQEITAVVKISNSNNEIISPKIKVRFEIEKIVNVAKQEDKGALENDNIDQDQPKQTSSDKVKSRRRSKRLSIHQAVSELDKTKDEQGIDEGEDPIPHRVLEETKVGQAVQNAADSVEVSKSSSKNLSSHDESTNHFDNMNDSNTLDESSILIDERVSKSRKGNVKRGKRSKVLDLKESNNDETMKQKAEVLKIEETTKPKKTLKKKLLSLTDLCEQNSVLLEPTRCTQQERPTLIPEKGKKGRKKKADSTSQSVGSVSDIENKSSENETLNSIIPASNVKKNGRGRKSKITNSGNETEIPEKVAGKKQRKRSSISKNNPETENVSNKKCKTLVDDTHIEDRNDETVTQGGSRDYSPIVPRSHDLTTQLNLTKDNTLVCSVRETTLSMSMSRAYTDSNMPSFLSQSRTRRSVDEFNSTQGTGGKKGKKKRVTERPVLSTLRENTGEVPPDGSSHPVGMRRGLSAGSLRILETSSTHRKNIRPSLVMTSLHSEEQDVIISVIKKLGGFVIAENVNETTSHVICGESRRTLNILQCLARGIWLVTKEWVLRSLGANCWIDEQEFEAVNFFPTCQLVRLEREKCQGVYRQTIFSNIGLVYISGRSSPPRPALVQLVKLCGGQVTGCLNQANVYVGSDFHIGLTCVKTNWLLDCISYHTLLPMERYYLDRPKKESSPVY